jgi:hypothetical protein
LDLFVALSTLIFICVGTAVGVRIVLRSRLDRSLPELAVGAALIAFAGVTQPFAVLRVALTGQIPISASIFLQLVVTAGSAFTVVALYVFTWRVFRPEARWAALLFAGGSALGLWACAGMAAISFYDAAVTPALMGQWIALSALSYAICFGWAALESLTYYVRLRRRLRLGLADPLLVNRFLLWGGACAFAFVIDGALMVMALGTTDFNRDPAPRLLVSASGLTNALAWFLGFTPPAWYVRWVGGTDRAAMPGPARG